MKTKINVSKFLIILLTISLAFIALGFFTLKSASAQGEVTRILPISTLESYELTSPINVYADDEVVAIIGEDNSLTVYKDGVWKKLTSAQSGFTTLKQVIRFSQDDLIVSSNGKISKVNLNTLSVSDLTYGNTIGCTSFDFNGNILATAYSTTAEFYTVENGVLTGSKPPLNNVTDGTIALNTTNFYYVSNNAIHTRNFEDFSNSETKLYDVAPSKMIANDTHLYYINNGKVFRLTVDGKENVELNLPASNYDLGKVSTVTDIEFYNGNLLITDKTNNCVQEFNIVGNDLIFTGFAIAKNKTAYNRIGVNGQIEKVNDTVAVLDANKITLISTEGVSYDNTSFINLFEGQAPKTFALGNGCLLGVNADNSCYIYDVDTENTLILSITGEIKDVCFKCGYFYILVQENLSSKVYQIMQTTGETVSETDHTQLFDLIEADANGNVYLADHNNIYVYSGDTVLWFFERIGAKKIIVDLAGNVFIGNGVNVYQYDKAHKTYLSANLDLPTAEKITDFSFSLEDDAVYFLTKDSEYVYSTHAYNNQAIENINLTSDFKVTSESTDIQNLSSYTVKETANAFKVTFDQSGFTFNQLVKPNGQYLLVDTLPITDTSNMLALVNGDGMILVFERDASACNIDITTAPLTAFITTTVHAYYLPIITMDLDYALSTANDKLLLQKHAHIKPVSKFTVFETDFYYAEITSGIYGYIPANFTVDVLSKDKDFANFTFEKVSPTAVYSDSGLTTKVEDISATTLKVFKVEGKIATVEYNGAICYINSSAIINESNNAIRNILILLAVITSLCGTISFFILKKPISK